MIKHIINEKRKIMMICLEDWGELQSTRREEIMRFMRNTQAKFLIYTIDELEEKGVDLNDLKFEVKRKPMMFDRIITLHFLELSDIMNFKLSFL